MKKLKFLANVINEFPEELMADFQQYYGLNSESIGQEISFHRAAILCAHLPYGSRVLREYNSETAWDETARLVARLDDNFRTWVWSCGEKNKRGKQPKPNIPPKNKKELEIEKKQKLKTEDGKEIMLVSPSHIANKYNYRKG